MIEGTMGEVWERYAFNRGSGGRIPGESWGFCREIHKEYKMKKAADLQPFSLKSIVK